MKIIAVDDEKLALDGLMAELANASPKADIHGFRSGEAALAYCTEVSQAGGRVDIAFLDVEMRELNGISLGEELLKLNPAINLIYITAHSNYAVEAINLRCSGYILKPVTADKIKREFENLRNPVPEETQRKLYVKAFGKFEAYIDGKPLQFNYKKTKELLAYLVDRRGELATNADILSALWEDDNPESSHMSYLKNIRTDLIKTLGEKGCLKCITRSRGEIGILPDEIDCDYYDYLENKDLENADRLLQDGYMSQYSWGEYTLATLYGGEEE